ncbi:Lrp/AsnC ligand binding domain-containing protein [Candidatus Nitrososphaera evergladensis]|uniref:Lrp/AsnC ligand binding domain-containing protein n=1 Tax=Candidatus Nitrososphaera evergladensis TaxID=1459637 RepID=UPI001D03E623|nr:Lrp/AsnC ligand binding domain-containing protein [Candidatus Nitrososphaera evergladensis]
MLLNCRFPFDARIIDELNKLSAVTYVYRTSGIYDLILKVTANTENELHKTVGTEIGTIRNVDSILTMVIA